MKNPAKPWAHQDPNLHATGVSKSIPDNLNRMRNSRTGNSNAKLAPSDSDTDKNYPMAPGKIDIPGYTPMQSALNIHIHTGRDVLMDGQDVQKAAGLKRRMNRAKGK